MKIKRRDILKASAALAALLAEPLLGRDAKAWLHPGAQSGIGHGWNTLPLGAGGLVTGFDIALDNSIVCRTDVGNIYRWTGKTTTTTNPSDQWVPLITFSTLAGLSSNPRTNYSWGALEIVQAPSDATKIWAIFPPLANGIVSPIYYSTDSAATWNYSGLTCANSDPNTPPYSKNAYHRIAVDPANPDVVYVGMCPSSGNSSGVYFADDGHTFSAALLDGVNPFPQTTNGTGACGICFDASSGTTIVGGQTRTKRIIIPVGGVDIYESNDGGQNFSITNAATAFGTAAFSLNCGVINSNGVYYACVNSKGVYRYSAFGGSWTNITPSAYTVGTATILIVDPASSGHGYLSVTGERGNAYGCTALDADSATPPSWTYTDGTSGTTIIATAPSYDCGYLNDIFGQGTNITFGMFATCAKIDGNGDTIFSGNQSIWKTTGRVVYNGHITVTWVSFGRGQEATVAQEAWRPTGWTYPVVGPQDFGVVEGNTFTQYPSHYFPPNSEFTCSSIEESPTDGNFVVFRVAGQGGGTSVTDSSGYVTGEGGIFTAYATFPTSLWASNVHGSITSGVLNATSFDSGTPLFVGQEVYSGGGAVAAGYISTFGSGTGGTGTYNLTGGVDCTSQALFLQAANEGGQIIAVDNDHHLTVPAGFSHGAIPAQTPDRGATWALCNGLPASNWLRGAWFGAPNSKPLAVGFGSDVGKAWAAALTGPTTVTIYKSTDSGANFSPTANTVTIDSSITSIYLLAVPGQPGHLWLVIGGTSGIWKSIDEGDTWTSWTVLGTPPTNNKIRYCSIGAIDPVSGTYPTIWMTGGNGGDPSQQAVLYYSINGASTWSALGSTGASGVKPDLPIRQQAYGLGSVRADRQIFKRLYCGCGQTGFAYYNP